MNDMDMVTRFYETLEKILLRCGLVGMVFVTVWFLLIFISGQYIHHIHSMFFEISWNEFQLMMYCGMGLMKITIFMLFLLPWVATRMVMRNSGKQL